MVNTFDVKVTDYYGKVSVFENCSSLASNLHGLLVWTNDSSYQIGNECKVEIINMR